MDLLQTYSPQAFQTIRQLGTTFEYTVNDHPFKYGIPWQEPDMSFHWMAVFRRNRS
jgi:hypothetical protein